MKEYRNKETGQLCYVANTTDNLIKAHFPDNQGEENGDYEQDRIFTKDRFNRQYEELTNDK